MSDATGSSTGGAGGSVVEAGTGGAPAPAGLAGLLGSPNLSTSPAVKAWLQGGGLDPRAVSVLDQALANYKIGLGSIEVMSDPVHVQELVITSVNGQPVGADNFAARDLVTEIAAIDPSTRPDEIGTPWPIHSQGFFADPTTAKSLRLAFEAPGTNAQTPATTEPTPTTPSYDQTTPNTPQTPATAQPTPTTAATSPAPSPSGSAPAAATQPPGPPGAGSASAAPDPTSAASPNDPAVASATAAPNTPTSPAPGPASAPAGSMEVVGGTADQSSGTAGQALGSGGGQAAAVSDVVAGQSVTSVSSPLLTSGQATFAAHLAALTGLSPRVIAAWELAEESGQAAQARQAASNFNWLNIGYFDSGAGQIAFNDAFADPVTAAEQTAKFLEGQWGGASSSIRAIVSTASQAPDAQMAAIANSDWASSHYYGGSSLRGTFSELADMQVGTGEPQ